MRYEFRGRCNTFNEVGHMKRDCTDKSFKHVKDFYCYNCHGIGHRENDNRKHKFDNDNRNSIMLYWKEN